MQGGQWLRYCRVVVIGASRQSKSYRQSITYLSEILHLSETSHKRMTPDSATARHASLSQPPEDRALVIFTR